MLPATAKPNPDRIGETGHPVNAVPQENIILSSRIPRVLLRRNINAGTATA
jgi:hypothetical protein